MQTSQEYKVGDRVRVIREGVVMAISPGYSTIKTDTELWSSFDETRDGTSVEVLERKLPVFQVGDVLENSTGTRFLKTQFGGCGQFEPAQWRGTDDQIYGEDTLVSSIRMVGGYVLYRGSERIEL